jgi:hypothetical protein
MGGGGGGGAGARHYTSRLRTGIAWWRSGTARGKRRRSLGVCLTVGRRPAAGVPRGTSGWTQRACDRREGITRDRGWPRAGGRTQAVLPSRQRLGTDQALGVSVIQREAGVSRCRFGTGAVGTPRLSVVQRRRSRGPAHCPGGVRGRAPASRGRPVGRGVSTSQVAPPADGVWPRRAERGAGFAGIPGVPDPAGRHGTLPIDQETHRPSVSGRWVRGEAAGRSCWPRSPLRGADGAPCGDRTQHRRPCSEGRERRAEGAHRDARCA